MKGIYKITSPSGKVYIGQTKNWSKRLKYYRNYNCKNQIKLFNSLNKYGFSEHIFEVLHELPEDVDQAILDNYEILYWEQHKSLGFNLLNTKNPGSGGSHSEESILKMRVKRLDYHKNNPTIREKLQTKIDQFDLSGKFIKTWNSLKEACENLTISYSNIKANLRGKIKTCKGYIFKYNE